MAQLYLPGMSTVSHYRNDAPLNIPPQMLAESENHEIN